MHLLKQHPSRTSLGSGVGIPLASRPPCTLSPMHCSLRTSSLGVLGERPETPVRRLGALYKGSCRELIITKFTPTTVHELEQETLK